MNKKLIGIIAILLLVVAIPITVFISQKEQDVRQRATGEEATVFFAERGSTNSATLSQINISPNQQKVLELFVDTGTNSINGFDITLNLGNALQHVTITDASEGTDAQRFETEIFKQINPTTGVIRFSKVTSDSTQAIQGKLHLGSIAFTVQSNANGTGNIGVTRAEITSPTRSAPLTTALSTLSYSIETSPPPTATPTTPSAATNTPTPTTPVPTVPISAMDVNRDGCVGIGDFNAWRNAYQGSTCTSTYPDLNNDSRIDLLDYNQWFITMTSLQRDGATLCTQRPVNQCPYSQSE